MIEIRKKVNLAPFSAFKIGGRAEYFCSVKTPEEIIEAIGFARSKKLPHKIFSGGSNIVFADGRSKGLFIRVNGGGIKVKKQKFLVDAGVALTSVIKKSINLSISGLESLSGIPGNVGGAIAGNAGAYGQSIARVVEKIEIWDGQKRRWLKNKDCHFRYRESVFKEKPYVLLRAVLKFKKGNRRDLKKTSQNIIKTRLKKYPVNLKCPGSFFKNVLIKEISSKVFKKIDKNKVIEGKIPAGYLLEQVGAKGMSFGGVRVSDFHGNLIVNTGKAESKDVRKLADVLKKKVKSKFGILLQEEIRYF